MLNPRQIHHYRAVTTKAGQRIEVGAVIEMRDFGGLLQDIFSLGTVREGDDELYFVVDNFAYAMPREYVAHYEQPSWDLSLLGFGAVYGQMSR